MARPRKLIDTNLLEGLARIGCTTEEMAVIVGCSKDTLERRFAALIEKGRSEMRMSLRRTQIRMAENGNVAMAIWLGKQHLNQADRQQIDATVTHRDFEVDIGGFIAAQTEDGEPEHVN